MADRSPSELTDESYWDGVWAERDGDDLDLAEYLNYRIAKLLDIYLPKKNLCAVEAGAGNSLWLPYIAQRYGYAVVGVDYSQAGCFLLKKNLHRRGTPGLVVQGDILRACLRPEAFDVVFSNGLIEHFRNYRQVLNVLKLWLKPGGRLITLIPNKRYLFRHVERWIAPSIFDTHLLLEPRDLERAYTKMGLQYVEAGYFGSFSTWKYTSRARPVPRCALRVLSRLLRVPVHAVLKARGWEPESQTFSPLIVAIGRVSGVNAAKKER